MRNFIKNIIGKNYKKFFYNFQKKKISIFLFHEVTDYPSEYQKLDKIFHTKNQFVEIIEWINKNFKIINMNDIDKINDEENKNFAAITFDDGFKGNFDFAIPYLIKEKIHSTHFINMKPILNDMPNIVATCIYLRKYIDEFETFEKKLKIKELSYLNINPEIYQKFIKEIKKQIDFKKILQFQGKLANLKDLRNFSDNNYVTYANHLFDHWNSTALKVDDFSLNVNLNIDHLKKFKNFKNYFAFPHGLPKKNFKQENVNILRKLNIEKIFFYSGDININYQSSNLFNRICIRDLKNINIDYYYSILRNNFYDFQVK